MKNDLDSLRKCQQIIKVKYQSRDIINACIVKMDVHDGHMDVRDGHMDVRLTVDM